MAAAAEALSGEAEVRVVAEEALRAGARVAAQRARRDRRWSERWGSARGEAFWSLARPVADGPMAGGERAVPALPGMAEMLAAATGWPRGPWVAAVEAAQDHIVAHRVAGRPVAELDGQPQATLGRRLSGVVAVEGMSRAGREAVVRIVVGHPGVEGLWERWRRWAAACVAANRVLDFPPVPAEVRRSWRGQMVRSHPRYERASPAERHAMRRREWEGRDDPLRWRPAAA